MNIQLLKHESFDKNLREELEKLLEDNFNILNTSEIYIENNKGNSQITIDNNKSLFNSPLGKKCLIISQIFTKNDYLAKDMIRKLDRYFDNDKTKEKYLQIGIDYSNHKTILSSFPKLPPTFKNVRSLKLWQKLNELQLDKKNHSACLKSFSNAHLLE
ncbi:MAG: hypothetical protein ACIPMY_01180 [Rickettsia endosymbiont of Pentastiridius leporinus]